MKIYTKTGDSGETGVIGGRVKKDSIIIQTLGSFDELNAHIGLLSELSKQHNLNNPYLTKLQNLIFNIGSELCGANVTKDFKKYIKELEREIDNISNELEPLTQFILPGGNILSSHAHICRTICRRTERQVVEYSELVNEQKPENMKIDYQNLKDILKFTNRLSDYFFVLARSLNSKLKTNDIYWDKNIN